MKTIKALIAICVVAVLGTSLSGCIVVPYRGGHGGHHHDRGGR